MTRRGFTNSYLAFSLVLAYLCLGCGARDLHRATAPAGAAVERARTGKNAVVLVIDGLRYTESFGDTAATHIPRMAMTLRPQGTLFEDFRNEGTTSTNPGHVSMLTGTWQDVANDGSERPDRPTIFEYFRAYYAAPAREAWMIAGKSKLDVCSYGTDPDYGAQYGATENVGDWGDAAVVDTLLAVLARAHPPLVVANLPGVDGAGHSGDRASYIDAIETADSLVLEVWSALESDPFYAGRTYLLVTNDHGRHDDDHGGFRDHGCSCEGCEHVTLLALGPDVTPGRAVSATYTLRDICSTLGEILGCPVPKSHGVVIDEIFAGSAAGVPAGER